MSLPLNRSEPLFRTIIELQALEEDLGQNQNVDTTKNTKTIQQKNVDPQKSNTPEPKIPQKERKI